MKQTIAMPESKTALEIWLGELDWWIMQIGHRLSASQIAR